MIILWIVTWIMSGLLTSPNSFAVPAAHRLATDIADIPIKPPVGWKAKTDQGAQIMIPGDVPEGKVYTVVVTPLQTKVGTLDEVYEIGKKTIAEAGTYTPLTKPARAQSD